MSDNTTVKEVYDTLTPIQKQELYQIVGELIYFNKKLSKLQKLMMKHFMGFINKDIFDA